MTARVDVVMTSTVEDGTRGRDGAVDVVVTSTVEDGTQQFRGP